MNFKQAFVVFTLAVPLSFAQQKHDLSSWPSVRELMASGDRGDPLREANLSPTEQEAVRSVTLNDIRDLCGSGDGGKEANIFRELVVDRIHLTNNGQTTILVEGGGSWEKGSRCLCGGTGNCQTWVVRVSGGKGTVLYSNFGWGFAILKSQSHGYFNFVTALNLGGGETDLGIGGRRRKIRAVPLRIANGERTNNLGEQLPAAELN